MTRVLVIVMSLVPCTTVLSAQARSASLASSAVIKMYCLSCHSGQAPAGRVSLGPLDVDHPAGDPETWESFGNCALARCHP